jgi:hypothetical protein
MPEEPMQSDVPASPQISHPTTSSQEAGPQKLGFKGAIKSREVWKGIILLWLCHLVWLLAPGAFIFIWALQLGYGLPLMVGLYYKKKDIMAQGVLIGMGFTFLLNTAICGIMVTGNLL